MGLWKAIRRTKFNEAITQIYHIFAFFVWRDALVDLWSVTSHGTVFGTLVDRYPLRAYILASHEWQHATSPIKELERPRDQEFLLVSCKPSPFLITYHPKAKTKCLFQIRCTRTILSSFNLLKVAFKPSKF